MKSKIIAVSLFLNVLLVLVACGGVRHAITNSNRLHAYVGALPGFHGLSANQTTSYNFSIVPELRAQSVTTVSFSGSYSGFCPVVSEGDGGPALPEGTAANFYGSGSLDVAACNREWYSDGLMAAENASGKQIVLGPGQIGPLAAWADSSTSTVKVYVTRAGQTIDTGISATLNGTRGQSTTTFPVLDGDRVVVVVVSDGTLSRNLQFVLAKE